MFKINIDFNIAYCKICRDNQSHISCSITFFYIKSCSLCDNVENNFTAGQTTYYNMAHAHCLLNTECYKHTLRICNTYSNSTAAILD
jgi:hypothetical protein